MLTLYFALYLLALIFFVLAAFREGSYPFKVPFIPIGLALVTLVWVIQSLNRLT